MTETDQERLVRILATSLTDRIAWAEGLEADIAALQAGGGGGGGGGALLGQAGAGSPVGTVTPTAQGYLYQDTDNGALYVATGATDADWAQVGGDQFFDGGGNATGFGFSVASGQAAILGDGVEGNAVYLSDLLAQNNSGNGLTWNMNGGDGAQTLIVYTGSSGQFTTTLADANGDMTVAHNVKITNAPIIGATAAPADGDLANSQVTLWLDDTPGSTALKIKAKDSAGTIRTATVPLS